MTSVTSPQEGPRGLGGWLIFVAIGLLVNPIRLLVYLLSTYPPLFQTGTWQELTTPGTPSYHALWAPLLIFELLGNSLLILGCWGLLVFLFRRSPRFPGLFVIFAVSNLVFIVLDAWLGSFVITDEPMFDSTTARELGRSLFTVCVWVPYMYRSKRVRNTFVESSAPAALN